MLQVEAQSRAIFAHLNEGNRGRATEAMAGMDASYARVASAMKSLSDILGAHENEQFAKNAAALQKVAAREKIATTCSALLVVGLLLYGRSLRQRAASVEKSERALLALHEQQRALENALNLSEMQQERLVEQDAMMRNAERIAKIGSWSWDVADDRVLWSPQMYRLFDVDQASAPGTYETYLNSIHPDDRERVNAIVSESLQTARTFVLEHRVIRTDGSIGVIYAESGIETTNGAVSRITGIAHDVTERRNAEIALLESEKRFEFAALATNDVVWDWNIATDKVWLSDAYKTQFGHERAGQMDAGVWCDNIHPEDLERIGNEIIAVLASSETSWTGEYRFRNAAGEWRLVYDRGYIARNSEGEPSRMIGAISDITEQRRAGESVAELNNRMDLVLRSAAEGIFGVDREGRLLFINETGANTLGWSSTDLMGRNMHEVVHHSREDGTAYPWKECSAYQTIHGAGAGTHDDEVFWKRDGSSVPVTFTSSPMHDNGGEIVGAVITFRDVTTQRAVEKMKDEFISTVSHELRTPLTSIRGALGVLASGRICELNEKASRLLEIATGNTDRLVRLINDILDIERIESGGIQLVKRRCVTSDLLRQAVDSLRPVAERQGVLLVCQGAELPVLADPDRIIQTLTNLIGNAIKFSPAGATVNVRCAGEADHVLFTVEDRGRGIPEGKLESIFGRFQQVDSSDAREKGGSGLGLAICRSLVNQHGGKIWAERRSEGGSIFTFTLPAEQQKGNASSALDHSILICDDDPAAREIIGSLLSGQGYVVREVSSGEELIASALAAPPDVILLDLFMPDMNGWETLARLKSEPLLASTPVVIISVLSQEETGVPFSNFSGWVQKPLHEESLVDALVNALQSGTRKPRLLVIEDDLDLARVIAASFERHGIETVHASSGREAIELSERMEPDMIVLDLVLPEIDGFGVIDWLKKNDRWRDVPLIIYSALEPTQAQQARLTLGKTEFVTKSRVSPDDFERRIVRFFDDFIMPATERNSHVA